MSEKTLSKPLFVWTIILLVLAMIGSSFASTMSFALKDLMDNGLSENGEETETAEGEDTAEDSVAGAIAAAFGAAFGTALVMIILIVVNAIALAVSLVFVIPGLIVSANLVKKSYGGYRIFAIIALCLFAVAILFAATTFVIAIL